MVKINIVVVSYNYEINHKWDSTSCYCHNWFLRCRKWQVSRYKILLVRNDMREIDRIFILSDYRWKWGLLFRNRKSVLNFLLSVTRSDESWFNGKGSEDTTLECSQCDFRSSGWPSAQNPRRQRMMKTGSDVLRPSNAALLFASVLRSCSMTGSSGISPHLRLLSQCYPSWCRSVPSGRIRGLLSNT